MFIGIAGIIGAGKSTLTQSLAGRLNYTAYKEPVEDNPYLNANYQDTFLKVKEKFTGILIGLVKKDEKGVRRIYKNPVKDFKIELGDYLIIIVNGNSFELIQQAFNVQEGFFKTRQN